VPLDGAPGGDASFDDLFFFAVELGVAAEEVGVGSEHFGELEDVAVEAGDPGECGVWFFFGLAEFG